MVHFVLYFVYDLTENDFVFPLKNGFYHTGHFHEGSDLSDEFYALNSFPVDLLDFDDLRQNSLIDVL